jgi:hypothetical protein
MRPAPVLVAVALCALAGAWFALGSRPRGAPPLAIEALPEVQGLEESAQAREAALEAPLASEEEVELEEAPSSASARESVPQAPLASEERASRAARPIRAILLDEATGEPLPRCKVSVLQGERRVEGESDDEGLLELSTTFEAGALVLLAHDGRKPWEGLAREHAWDGSADPQWWRAPAGPTVRLSWTPREKPAEELVARLHWKVVEDESGRERGAASEVLPLREPLASDATGAPWVRFPPIRDESAKVERVGLASKDGCWGGSVPMALARGRVGALHVDLQARSALEVRVKSLGAALPQALVVLEFEDGRKEEKRADDRGVLQWRQLRPGVVKLRARHLAVADLEVVATLSPGEPLVQELECARLPIAGDIAGVVRSDSGAYQAGATLVLRDEARPGLSLRARARWRDVAKPSEERPRFEGSYRFVDLPAGAWIVSVEESDAYDWTPRSKKCAAGDEEVDFRVKDGVPVADFRFEPRSATSGLPLERFHLVLETHEGNRDLWARHGEVVLRDWPLEKPFRWRIDAAEHRPERGDSKAAVAPAGRERERVLSPAVQYGWGEWVRVVSTRRNQPIKDAVVVADGREVARTNQDGWARLRLAAAPKSLEARHPGHAMARPADLRPARERRWTHIALVLRPAR